MNIAIIGCGLAGRKRWHALRGQHRVVMTVDSDRERAEALAASSLGTLASTDWTAAVTHPEVETVIISTTNNCLAPMSEAAIENGKHVLVEKPAARTPQELDQVLKALVRRNVCAWVGFNHRYHPALQRARVMVDSGELGQLMFIRGRYGHGGRLGYDREWRADPELSGGGELLDQGVHLIDLARWFLGDFPHVVGSIRTYFWQMTPEDNGFMLLQTQSGQTAWLHASSTEWKNLFSFEIYGKKGKLHVEGLGGSYGVERLSYYKMSAEMGPPETVIWEYPGEDLSWQREFDAFLQTVKRGAYTPASLENARAALQIVHKIYQETPV